MAFFWKIKDKLQRLKWFIQRGRTGFADCDIWNFGDYLAEVIIKGLEEFKKSCNYTHPPQFSSGDEWAKALGEIITGLKAYQHLIDYTDPDWIDMQKKQEWEKAFNNSIKLLNEYWICLWN